MFGRRTVNTLLLEGPIDRAVVPGSRRLVLRALLEQLEAWLPAEEDRLVGAQQQNRPLAHQEADWHAMLGLYERLSTVVG